MFNPDRWAYFETEAVADLQGKPFSDFNQRFQLALLNNDLDDALRTANHAAADHGAAGFLLRHQVNSIFRNKNVAHGESPAQDGLNMLSELVLAKKLCEECPQYQTALDELHPNRSNDFWDERIKQFAEEAEESARLDEAEYTASTMITYFMPDPKAVARREALIDAIIPSRMQTLSKAKRELSQTTTKALQDDPQLKAEKLYIPHPKGYVEGVQIQHGSHQQRVIIHCRGSGEFYQEYQADFIQEAKRNNAIVVGFNYPSVGESSKTPWNTVNAVNAIKAVVEFIHDKTQIDYNDITIEGHSLGAALGTLAAAELHAAGHPVRIVNGRSFSSSEKAASLPSGYLSKKSESLQENPDLKIEPGPALMRIPQSHRLLICGDKDPVITTPCSMLEYVCQQTPEKAQQIRQESLFTSQLGGAFIHNSDLKFLKNAQGQTASDVVAAFVQKSVPIQHGHEPKLSQ